MQTSAVTIVKDFGHDNPVVQRIFSANQRFCEKFNSPEQRAARKNFDDAHKVTLAATMCSDGRARIGYEGAIPEAAFELYRTVGGHFRIGMPYFTRLMHGLRDYVLEREHVCLMLNTYHFSKSGDELGCAGFEHNTTAARAAMDSLCGQFRNVFGDTEGRMHPLCVGIETNEESLVFHGQRGQTLNIGDVAEPDDQYFANSIANFFPGLPNSVCHVLEHLMEGNYRHVLQIRKLGRPENRMLHNEQALCFGGGFSHWLDGTSIALVLNQYVDWAESFVKMLTVLQQNIIRKHDSVPKEDGLALFCVGEYRGNSEIKRKIAIEKAYYLLEQAERKIRETRPALVEHFHCVRAILNTDDYKLELV